MITIPLALSALLFFPSALELPKGPSPFCDPWRMYCEIDLESDDTIYWRCHDRLKGGPITIIPTPPDKSPWDLCRDNLALLPKTTRKPPQCLKVFSDDCCAELQCFMHGEPTSSFSMKWSSAPHCKKRQCKQGR